jgi:hypothetical protein
VKAVGRGENRKKVEVDVDLMEVVAEMKNELKARD